MQKYQGNKIDEFYSEVLKDFIERLFLAYRFKSAVTSQQIDNLMNKVKEKMKKKGHLFKCGVDSVLNKEQTKIAQEKQQATVDSMVKIQHEQNNDLISGRLRRISEVNEPHAEVEEDSDDSQEDDLKQFEKQPEVKEEEIEKVQPKEENSESDESDFDERLKEEIMKKSANKIGGHIIATYNTKNKKHIPKQEKTKIDLENVFLRLHDREFFYNKLGCQFSQADYSNIQL